MFTRSLINKVRLPVHNILVCEDSALNQSKIAATLVDLLDPKATGDIEILIDFVTGGLLAAACMQAKKYDLILLDHDMPDGNGTELIRWMQLCNINTPIMTFSGLPNNNIQMMNLGANYLADKFKVINGAHNDFILNALRNSERTFDYLRGRGGYGTNSRSLW